MRFPTRTAVPQSKSIHHCDSCLDLSELRAKFLHLRRVLGRQLLPENFEEWLAATRNNSDSTGAQIPLPSCEVCRPVYVNASIYQSKSQHHCESCLHLSNLRAKYLHPIKGCPSIGIQGFEKWMVEAYREFDTSVPLPRCEECRPIYMRMSIYRSKSQFHCEGCLYLRGPRTEYFHLRAEGNRFALTRSFKRYMIEELRSGRLSKTEKLPHERCEECCSICVTLSNLQARSIPRTTSPPQSNSIPDSSSTPQSSSVPKSIPVHDSIPPPEASPVPESKSRWHCGGCSYLIGLRSDCRRLRMGLDGYAKRVGTQSHEEYIAARSRQTTYRLEAGKLPAARCEECCSIYDCGVFVCEGYSASPPPPSDSTTDDIPQPSQQPAAADSANNTILSKSFLRRAVSPLAKRVTAASSNRSPLSPGSTLKSNRAHGFISKTKEGSKSGSGSRLKSKLKSVLKAGLNKVLCCTHEGKDYRVLPPRPITPPRQQPGVIQGQISSSFTASSPATNMQSAPSMPQWNPAAGYSTTAAPEAAIPSIPTFQYIPPNLSDASMHDTPMGDTSIDDNPVDDIPMRDDPMDYTPSTPSPPYPHTTIDSKTDSQSTREREIHYWKSTKGRATFKEQIILSDPKAKLIKFSALVSIAVIQDGSHFLVDDIKRKKQKRSKQQRSNLTFNF